MGCCPPPPAKAPLWTETPAFSQPTFMKPGENVDCYMARSGNTTGDQANTLPIPDKIGTNTIAVNCSMQVNEQMVMTTGSPPPTSWQMVDPASNTPTTISGLTFTSAGKLSGTFDPQAEGKTFTIKIRAMSATNEEIDSRSYTIIPKICKASVDLSFIHPLPGSETTSNFGPRKKPVAGASTDHKGVDFAYIGGVTKDVVAACDGIVLFVGEQRGYGKCVTLRHKNGSGVHICDTHYAHLASIYCKVGQAVPAGQAIGKEGNTGIGSGAHLHFELRLKGTTKTDPLPYIRGSVKIAESTTGDSSTPSSTPTTRENGSNVALTKEKAENNPCPVFTDPGPGEPATPTPPEQVINSTRKECCPEPTPSLASVKASINAVLDRHPELTSADRNFILYVAQIESRFDPCAKNKNSSATGLYQFLDALAKKYYGKMGIPPTCENRVNPEHATEAMVRFYKAELLPYYNGWQASGQTKIAGKNIVPTAHSARYGTLSKECWLYGLCHHDGVGNAVKGIDLQGVAYFQKKLREG